MPAPASFSGIRSSTGSGGGGGGGGGGAANPFHRKRHANEVSSSGLDSLVKSPEKGQGLNRHSSLAVSARETKKQARGT